jgi:hypothetical protein
VRKELKEKTKLQFMERKKGGKIVAEYNNFVRWAM